MIDTTPSVAPGPIDSLLTARRSIRRFEGAPLPAELVRELIDEARWAPSPHNSQPWRFVHLQDSSKARLARAMADELRHALEQENLSPAEIEAQCARSMARIHGAPTALLVCVVDDGLVFRGQSEGDRLERQMAVQSVGTVLQSLFLAAAARGIGTCWMAAPMYCPERVRTELELDSGWNAQALVLMGRAGDSGRIRPRLPLDSVVVRR